MRAAFFRQTPSAWVRDNFEHFGVPWRGGAIVVRTRRDADGGGMSWSEAEVMHPDHPCGHVLISRAEFHDLTGRWPPGSATIAAGHWV